mmetsp:Transcript_12300/g.40202  ORF Transcript_12300/g.40202 Transcript_12300/m.40202 type:complete len:253 (+) Transcript_12300:120-878(+)|eukprot:CAMPEP_0118890912 /NCGR_PEP_ID=MMETSP1166-20130328/1157_1 /TAXON_ID=1104430 /ORGANISM="Chrysoreinhardia sp, Strain CCMP3193" /LENGTH=252 /DNA_ID=CAMNT_0006829545 /DNA_START=120 /DNA_END=878 /DNA_ORIENTATION=-
MSLEKPLVTVLEMESLLERVEARARDCETQRLQLSGQAALLESEWLLKTEAMIRELKAMSRELEGEKSRLATAQEGLHEAAASAAKRRKTEGSHPRTAPGTTLGKFVVPEWIDGRTPATLVASKGDKTVATLDLAKRDCFVFGRQPELCHVTLDHASVSRQHAVLLHGAPPESRHGWFLIDLGSAHGTLIQTPSSDDMKRCRPDTPYALPFGTSFKIGKSSRLYTLLCESESETAAAQKNKSAEAPKKRERS